MKLSQLLKVMDKADDIIIYACKKSIADDPLFRGNVRNIHRDSPLNFWLLLNARLQGNMPSGRCRRG